MNDISPPPAESNLVAALLSGRFALTAEVVPPLSGDAKDLLERAEPLRGMVDAINVTDSAMARVTMSSLASAGVLAANGLQPVMQITCRDRNRIGLLNDLLGASALGINNILCMRGDDPSAGPYADAKPVFDVGATELIQWASEMAYSGKIPASAMSASRDGDPPEAPTIQTAPRLFIGAAESPVDPPEDWEPEDLQRKIKAGAQFAQTQLCYDIGLVERYFSRLRNFGITEQIFILIGTGPMASARSARWMNENLWGVTVPDAIIDRLDAASDPKAEGIEICTEFLQELTEIPGVAGAHLMAPGNAASLPEVIKRANLGR